MSLLGLVEEVPGHGVRVASSRGDEDPQICGLQQLGSQVAISRYHGIDVGGVQNGQPFRDPRLSNQLEARGVIAGNSGTHQRGQHPVTIEPRCVVRVVDENRRGRGGTNDAGPCHHSSDQRIDQGGLSGTCRPTDHGEQRCVDGLQPRKDVVVELVGNSTSQTCLGDGPGQIKGKLSLTQVVPQIRKRQQHLLGVHGDPSWSLVRPVAVPTATRC